MTRCYDYSRDLPRLVAVITVTDPPPYQVTIPHVGRLHAFAESSGVVPVHTSVFTLRPNEEGFEYVSFEPVPMPTHPQEFADLANAFADAEFAWKAARA